jgi:hypothetical protein
VRNVREGGYKDSEFATFNHKKKNCIPAKALLKPILLFRMLLSAIYYLRNANVRDFKSRSIF